MEEKLTTAHRLTLWRLAVAGGIEWAKSIVPKLTPAVREKLVDLGLVRVHREKDPKSKRPSLKLELTAEGWNWTAANMKMELLEGSPGAGDVLQHLMAVLHERFAESEITPEDVFRSAKAKKIAGKPAEEAPAKAEKPDKPAPKKAAPPVKASRREDAVEVVEEDVFFEPDKPRTEPAAREKESALPGRFHTRMPASIVDASIKRGYLDTTRGYIEVPVSIGELRWRVHLEQHEFDEALARMRRESKLEIDESNGKGDAATVIFHE